MKKHFVLKFFLLISVYAFFTSITAKSQEVDLYWFDHDLYHVNGGNLESGATEIISEIIPRYPAAMDIADGALYWANGSSYAIRDLTLPHGIWKGDPQDPDSEKIIETNGKVIKVRVDIQEGRIYWVETNTEGTQTIRKINPDTGDTDDLVQGDDITSIRLHSSNGFIYWSDRSDGAIRRANLDGSNIEEIVSGITPVFVSLQDFALDVESSALYWMDTGEMNGEGPGIYKSDTDGNGIEKIINLESLPVSMTIDSEREKIYWSRLDGNLYRADLNDTEVDTFVTGLRLGNRELTFNKQDNKLYWVGDSMNAGRVWSSDPDGNNLQVHFEGFGTPISITIDPIKEQIFWTTFSNEVMMANIDGSGITRIADGLHQSAPIIESLSVDPHSSRLFWGIGSQINLVNYEAESHTQKTFTEIPYAARLFTANDETGQIYWTGSASGELLVLRVHTPDEFEDEIDIIIDSDRLNSAISGIAADFETGFLYWTEKDQGKIRFSDLEGISIETLLNDLNNPFGLALDSVNRFLYWTEQQSGKIKRTSLENPEIETVFAGLNAPGKPFVSSEKLGVSISDLPSDLPREIELFQNYPNPFNPVTVISYQLPVHSEVRLEVFDLLGRRVAVLVDGILEAGAHEAAFDASNLASGVYIYRIQAGDFVQSKKMLLMK